MPPEIAAPLPLENTSDTFGYSSQPVGAEYLYSSSNLRTEYISWISKFPFSWFISLTFPFPKSNKEAAIEVLRRFVHRFERAVYGKNRAGKTANQRLSMIAFIESHYLDSFHFHCLVQAPTDTGKIDEASYLQLFRKIWAEVGGSLYQFDCQQISSATDIERLADYCTAEIFKDKDLIILTWFHARTD